MKWSRKMKDLMYPAYQKFYSAICALEKFDKENDFFDNISSLDKFFSEYRNVTFVLQKSIAHTKYMSVYDEIMPKYLNHWFVEKRNMISKVKPFDYIKIIKISVYCPNGEIGVMDRKFTIEDEENYSLFSDEIRNWLMSFKNETVCFSVNFSFYENNSDEELISKLNDGVYAMNEFLYAMQCEIKDKSSLCERIRKKIKKKLPRFKIKGLFMNVDYEYYPQKKYFRKATQIDTLFEEKTNKNQRLEDTKLKQLIMPGENYFKAFVKTNLIFQTTQLMPTIWVVYNDDTFDIKLFRSDTKTTFYRKINDTVKDIENSNVKEIYSMFAYSSDNLNIDNKANFGEKLVSNDLKEYLVFIKIDRDLNQEEYVFEGDQLKDYKYISKLLQQGPKTKLDYAASDFQPVLKAFEAK